MTFMAANARQRWRRERTSQPGLDYFKKLADAGNFVAIGRPSQAASRRARPEIAILWDYNALPMRDNLASRAGRADHGRHPE